MNELIINKLQSALPDVVEDVDDFRNEYTIIVPANKLFDVLRFLKEDEALAFNFLADIVADDLLPAFPRFAVNYHLRSLQNKQVIRVRTYVEDPDEGPDTVAPLWKIGTWLEMEVYDLMGIRFAGNDSLRRLFLPEDWIGHPLRKDYPLGYEEVQFSFNWQEVDASKPYAKD